MDISNALLGEKADWKAAGVVILVLVLLIGAYFIWFFIQTVHTVTVVNRSDSRIEGLVVKIGDTRTSKIDIPMQSEVEVELTTIYDVTYELFRVSSTGEVRLGQCIPWPEPEEQLWTRIEITSLSPPQFSCELTGRW